MNTNTNKHDMTKHHENGFSDILNGLYGESSSLFAST
jgi:hypothetical protein